MSYIAFQLDALNKVGAVAKAAQIPREHVTDGLVHLWAHCFRDKASTVSSMELLGFFGGDDPDRLGRSLVAFGFLEAAPHGWRVKGVDRYLRVREAQSKGGKEGRAKSSSPVGKRKVDLEVSARSTLEDDEPAPEPKSDDSSNSSTSPKPKVSARSPAGSTSRSTSRSEQALTPNTEGVPLTGNTLREHEGLVSAPLEPGPGGPVGGAGLSLSDPDPPHQYPGMDPDEDPRVLPDWCIAELEKQADSPGEYVSPTFGPRWKFFDAELQARATARSMAEAKWLKAERQRRLN